MNVPSLLDLGEDVLVSHIIPNLAIEDIQALKQTCKSLYSITEESSVWAELYKKTFGSKPTPFGLISSKWPELFKLRSKSRLYTWGSPTAGRLGYKIKDIPQDHVNRHGFEQAIFKPTLVSNFKNTVLTDVTAGGFSFQILTSQGHIYSTGSHWHKGQGSGPGPKEEDAQPSLPVPEGFDSVPLGTEMRSVGVMPMPFMWRRALRPPRTTNNDEPPQPQPVGRPIAPIPTSSVPLSVSAPETEPETPQIERKYTFDKSETVEESGFITKMNIPSDNKIVSISSGREHFIALDDHGDLWTWDHPRQTHGIRLKFTRGNSTNIVDMAKGNIITMALAGWNISCVYILNVGIVVWNCRDSLKTPDSRDTPVNAHYKVIYGTGELTGPDKVVDIMVGQSFLCYVTNEGKLWKMDLDAFDLAEVNRPYEVKTFNSFLQANSLKNQSVNTKFVKLSGSYNHFAVFSDDDTVLIGNKDDTKERGMKEPVMIQELQQRDVISIAVGDYHFLALLRNGDVLTWGLESKYCGCFGLGGEQNINSKGGVSMRNGISLKKPTKVDDIGKVLAIAGAGWQSCAIVADN